MHLVSHHGLGTCPNPTFGTAADAGILRWKGTSIQQSHVLRAVSIEDRFKREKAYLYDTTKTTMQNQGAPMLFRITMARQEVYVG